MGAEEKLPVIVHCREAHADLIQLLENFNKPAGPDARGVMHCFSGSWQEAKRYLNLGFLISFTGIITFSNFDQEILKKIAKVHQDAEKLMNDFRKLGSHLKNAGSAYSDSENRLKLLDDKVEKLVEINLLEC